MECEMKQKAKILIADDQADVLKSLQLLFKGEGYTTDQVMSPGGVLNAIKTEEYDIMLMDLNYTRDTTSGKEGITLLNQIREVDATLPVVVMTGWSSVSVAVEALQNGARDFIEKPWDNSRLLSIIHTQIELSRSLRKTNLLEAENRILRSESGVDMIAESEAMKPVVELIHRIGPSDANVLILGENGTGKGIAAQALHAASNRREKTMVTVNAGGLSEGVFASELFGHEKGAFTDAKADRAGRFEIADQGTLFLDEIANVPSEQQTKLLRVLETGEYERVGSSKTRKADVRIVSATNADIYKEVQENRFRQDLLYRLNTVEIVLPPLRERRRDIPLLAVYFMKLYAKKYRKNVKEMDSGTMQFLLSSPWRGNVRELSHVMERAVLMAQSSMIRESDLSIRIEQDPASIIDGMTIEEVERLLIQKALSRYQENVSKTAKALGLSRSALYRRMGKYGL